MFSFKLSFRLSNNQMDSKETSIKLIDERDIYLTSSIKNKPLCDSNSVEIVGSQYETYREAAIDMLRVEQAFKMSALSEHVGVSLSNEGHDDYPLHEMLKNMEKPFLGSGVMFKQLVFRRVFEARTEFFDPNPSQEFEPIQCANLVSQFDKYYTKYNVVFDLLPAIDMLNSIRFEYSSKVRLILSMTVVEMLSDPKNTRTPEEIELIDKLMSDVEISDIDENKKKSLSLAIAGCKSLSISNSCKKLVKSKLGKKRAEDFYRLYNYRSRVVHSGGIEDPFRGNDELQAEIYKAAGEANLLASDLVDAVLEEHINDGQPQFMEL
ncbi:hypothetical protein [Vreelandella hamiltonii]|uniref:Apea-like HEPN domain-containing protein n=1 Tax=Vreelandella hamiltonii TaxID=502829 RepID=A0A8H9M0R9_9GAMM|nr:hypothetical protein [Halomonas hamiltonii]GGW27089.1 hypothetical protein GCM10007157_19200 [Halomonas hamiltonii]